MLASAHGHIETVTVLLAHRDSRGVNAQNKVRKNTPKRCRNTKLRDQDIYRTLPLCLSQDGWTALMAAAKHGHTQTVGMLLSHPGIDVNLQNEVMFI